MPYLRYFHGKNVVLLQQLSLRPITTYPYSLRPSDIVYHDHSYCTPYSDQSHVPSTQLTPVVLPLVSSTANVGTQATSSPFCIQEFANKDAAIHSYTGFNDYCTLKICFDFFGKSVHHLKYWGSKSTVTSFEKRGIFCVLTPINDFFFGSLPYTMWTYGDRPFIQISNITVNSIYQESLSPGSISI